MFQSKTQSPSAICRKTVCLLCTFKIDPALAGGKTMRKLEAANSNQRRFGYIRSLKYHLLVMLGARIYVVEASIWNLITYLLPVPDKKPTTAVVKHDRTMWTGQKQSSKMLAFAAHTSYQKRFNKVLSFVVMGVSKDFLCISPLCSVWNNVCVHVCKTTNWRFICLIICNCKYIVVINCGWNNNVAVKIVAYWNIYIFMTR